MEAIRLTSAELTKEKIPGPAKDTYGRRGDSKKVLRGPTYAEVTFGPLRDIRFSQQHMFNNFARLLNRGSSLE